MTIYSYTQDNQGLPQLPNFSEMFSLLVYQGKEEVLDMAAELGVECDNSENYFKICSKVHKAIKAIIIADHKIALQSAKKRRVFSKDAVNKIVPLMVKSRLKRAYERELMSWSDYSKITMEGIKFNKRELDRELSELGLDLEDDES